MRKPVDAVNNIPAASPDEVLEAVHAVMHQYRSRQLRALREQAEGLSHMDSRVLGFFARHPGATLTDLVAHAGRDKGQLARLVTGLKDRGLLEARADESDRRSSRLHLTEAGRQAHQLLRRQGRRLSGVAVRGFSDADRQQLVELLARLQSNLEADEG